MRCILKGGPRAGQEKVVLHGRSLACYDKLDAPPVVYDITSEVDGQGRNVAVYREPKKP